MAVVGAIWPFHLKSGRFAPVWFNYIHLILANNPIYDCGCKYDYLKYIIDQLEGWAPFETKRMFGGVGFFREEICML